MANDTLDFKTELATNFEYKMYGTIARTVDGYKLAKSRGRGRNGNQWYHLSDAAHNRVRRFTAESETEALYAADKYAAEHRTTLILTTA